MHDFTNCSISSFSPLNLYFYSKIPICFLIPLYLQILRLDEFDSSEHVNHGDLDLQYSQAHANANTRAESKWQKDDRVSAPFIFFRKAAQRCKN